ncbi:hypothetical protein GGTG_05839 [Gaeumannomyces tritici R3-111a-1]|uniref:Uncharacterized protein n=1 Tax=Gaeumannomyces tritici (strain R3-111a-1) TaxID=644352 RepID=J3NX32_GAET3|nr:hypothetical protein GGTG_05839 [Gaeumannomyces tritici R3-111a-1]EJT75914.1 hypothetical protein GGTG_05839 [Gaeumannomyces tritici R3-111a-1]
MAEVDHSVAEARYEPRIAVETFYAGRPSRERVTRSGAAPAVLGYLGAAQDDFVSAWNRLAFREVARTLAAAATDIAARGNATSICPRRWVL